MIMAYKYGGNRFTSMRATPPYAKLSRYLGRNACSDAFFSSECAFCAVKCPLSVRFNARLPFTARENTAKTRQDRTNRRTKHATVTPQSLFQKKKSCPERLFAPPYLCFRHLVSTETTLSTEWESACVQRLSKAPQASYIYCMGFRRETRAEAQIYSPSEGGLRWTIRTVDGAPVCVPKQSRRKVL